MPNLTTRYGLKKPVPDGSETADLRVWVGENMDLLDVAIGHVEDKADAAGQAAATAQQTATAAQQAASAAQAAADAAQETADTALSAAQSAGQAAANAQATADAAVPRGDNNRAVALLHTLLVGVDTRQLHATAHDDDGNPIAWELRDTDGTVIATATETYNDAGMPVQMVITVPRPDHEPDIIITITQVYDEDGVTFLRREQEVAYA